MGKVVVMTLAYARPEFVCDSLVHFLNNSLHSEYDRHVVVDVGYPLPDAVSNSMALQAFCLRHAIEYVQRPNLGCHKNWDAFAREFCWGDDDILVGVCPDTRVSPAGWISKGVHVLKSDSDCFTVQMNRPGDYAPYFPEDREVGGVKVVAFPGLVAWSCGMFNMELVKLAGGFDAYNPYYGWSEHYLVDKLLPMGKRWYFLKEHFDNGLGSPDMEYTQWKIESAGGATKLRFDEWLMTKGRL